MSNQHRRPTSSFQLHEDSYEPSWSQQFSHSTRTFRQTDDYLNDVYPKRPNSQTYLDKIREKKRNTVLSDPTVWAKETRDLLKKDMSIPLPRKIKRRNVGGIPTNTIGRRIKGNLYKQAPILPKENQLNPALPLPPIAESELDKGLINLINRKLVPSFIDLSPLVNNDENSPITASQAVLNPYHYQLVKKNVQTEDTANSHLYRMESGPPSPEREIPYTTRSNPTTRKKEPSIVPFGNQKIYNLKSKDATVYMPKNYIQQPIDSVLDPTEEQRINSLLEATNDRKKQQYLRTYIDLMDEYSLHHVIIRHGSLLDNTPEYLSFYRTYQYNWSRIYSVLSLLEKLLRDFTVPLAYVDGKKVVFLAERTIDPNNRQLIDCLVNAENVIPYIKLPDVKFMGRNGQNNAATCIQRIWKGYIQRKRFSRLKYEHKMATRIQFWWFLRVRLFRTKEKIQKIIHDEEFKWKSKMDEFKKNWDTIKKSKRTIIHINSLTYDESVRTTTPKFKSSQNSQLFRILDLLDPNVEVVYVTSEPLDSDVLSYVCKLLEFGGVEEPMRRLKVITPESNDKYPDSTSLSSLVYYSQRTMRHLRTLVMGKTAYLVPGQLGKDDLRLAIKLQLPILGSDPVNSTIYGTKSGSKRIFAQAEVNMPFGIYDIYEEEDLISNLSRKLMEYPQYSRWIIKIDNEYGGRGLAFLDVNKLSSLKEKRRNEPMFAERLRANLAEELGEYMPERLNIVSKHVYPQWPDFLKALKDCGGGVIEAVPNKIIGSPSVNLFIEPNGEVNILSVQEQLVNSQYCTMSCSFPHYSAPYDALREASFSVGRVCHSKKIFGYVTIDFVIFVDEKDCARMWAVDLKLRLTDNALSHRMFELITKSRFDKDSGQSLSSEGLESEINNRSYIYSGMMRNPAISSWHHSSFFSDCRVNGFSLDGYGKFGVIFQQVDSLLRGQLGVLCIGKTARETSTLFCNLVNYLISLIPKEDRLPIGYDSNLKILEEIVSNLVHGSNE
ncbi:hypothetical protein NAEGRDRAFT_69956 [Naegleria gruberi]|uniref:IQCH-like ATP-grasp domain-containing protein n=1 Tax=Naegleria gruberi TaxID=5762 RepID=D2VLZ6_NAEGR|nr:uncharacterized protein NAEGRDRAFT_69956 [Naegleria gruberi]EFC42140.1 hypothetical protein NAEGRDRAFT_69956 [Naegleria gruberi]|eukprot:XP_002674884.1 hypothetical protein NAEGRDRAFT_69956 [Naegleria gruberi strain NEG-M]